MHALAGWIAFGFDVVRKPARIASFIWVETTPFEERPFRAPELDRVVNHSGLLSRGRESFSTLSAVAVPKRRSRRGGFGGRREGQERLACLECPKNRAEKRRSREAVLSALVR